jgi:hypothetical protein
MSAEDVVNCGLCNHEFGAIALQRFLEQKQTTIVDDDVTVLGHYDYIFGLQALQVYIFFKGPVFCATKVTQ